MEGTPYRTMPLPPRARRPPDWRRLVSWVVLAVNGATFGWAILSYLRIGGPSWLGFVILTSPFTAAMFGVWRRRGALLFPSAVVWGIACPVALIMWLTTVFDPYRAAAGLSRAPTLLIGGAGVACVWAMTALTIVLMAGKRTKAA